MQIATGVFIDREEREVFFVVPELRAELGGDWRPVLLVTAISRQGVLMLWPIPLPDGAGGVTLGPRPPAKPPKRGSRNGCVW